MRNEADYAGDKIRESLRTMAWQRAKGELLSMLQTFWDGDTSENFEPLNQAIDDFITNVESNEWER